MSERLTDKSYPVENIWIFKSLIWTFLVAFIFIVTAFAIGRLDSMYIIYLLFIVGLVFFNALRKKNFHYALEDKFLTVQQGIINKQQRHIPYGVIQQIFVKQDLFDRIFGLASVRLENASMGGSQGQKVTKFFGKPVSGSHRRGELIGFEGNTINIPGLSKQNAEIVKNLVLQKMKENPIDDNQSGL